MDKSRLKDLERTVVKVVKRASRPGGSIEREEFTMGIARKEVCKEMGLENGGLDHPKWKGTVRKLVLKAVDDVTEEQEGEQSSVVEAEQSPSPPPTRNQAQTGKTKRKKRAESDKEEEASDEYGTYELEESPKSESKSKGKRMSAAANSDEEPEEKVLGDKSESEMSSLYDEPPAKRRSSGAGKEKPKERESAGKKDGGKKAKKTDENLSAEESKVVDLKKIVVACGIRKQWSREFVDHPTTRSSPLHNFSSILHSLSPYRPREQIRHLESILRELGMKGQPTLGKARSLKGRRELAAELDDVRQFEAARGLSSDKGTRRKTTRIVSEGESEESEEGPKEPSALGAILDFLGDESD